MEPEEVVGGHSPRSRRRRRASKTARLLASAKLEHEAEQRRRKRALRKLEVNHAREFKAERDRIAAFELNATIAAARLREIEPALEVPVVSNESTSSRWSPTISPPQARPKESSEKSKVAEEELDRLLNSFNAYQGPARGQETPTQLTDDSEEVVQWRRSSKTARDKPPRSDTHAQRQDVKFSRRFLSESLGGGIMQSTCTVSKERRDSQVYDVAEYSCWDGTWNPRIPLRRGTNGSLLCMEFGSGQPRIRDHPPRHMFCRRRSNEWEYVGLYIHGRQFTPLTSEEYADQLPEATKDKWASNFITTNWGTTKLVEVGLATTKEAARRMRVRQIRAMMDRGDSDDDKPKLRMWWDALEFQRYDSAFYEALCAKGREQGSTTNGDNDGFPFGHPSEDQAGDAVNEGDGGEERVKFPEGVFVENPNGLYEDEARADRDANDDNGDEQGRRDGEEQEEQYDAVDGDVNYDDS